MLPTVIIRTRNMNDVQQRTIDVLNENNIKYYILPHPTGKTFGEFNNDIFSALMEIEWTNDEYIMLLDDDVIPSFSGIMSLMSELENDPELCGVSSLLVPNDITIARIYKATQMPNFCFGGCIIRKAVLSRFQMPPEMECSEDDYFQIWCQENGFKLKISDIQCIHYSNDWRKKYVKDWEWHIASGKLNYHGEINMVSTFHYTEKGILEQMVKWAMLLTRHDRKLAKEVPKAMRRAFDNPEQYIKNR